MRTLNSERILAPPAPPSPIQKKEPQEIQRYRNIRFHSPFSQQGCPGVISPPRQPQQPPLTFLWALPPERTVRDAPNPGSSRQESQLNLGDHLHSQLPRRHSGLEPSLSLRGIGRGRPGEDARPSTQRGPLEEGWPRARILGLSRRKCPGDCADSANMPGAHKKGSTSAELSSQAQRERTWGSGCAPDREPVGGAGREGDSHWPRGAPCRLLRASIGSQDRRRGLRSPPPPPAFLLLAS